MPERDGPIMEYDLVCAYDDLLTVIRQYHGPDGGCCRCGQKVCDVRNAIEVVDRAVAFDALDAFEDMMVSPGASFPRHKIRD